jgi:hypothetical protein
VTDLEGLGLDMDADASLDEVLEARADRMGEVRELIAGSTQEDLDGICLTNPADGYPAETGHRMIACLWTVIDEEWAHHQYATRDLAVLEARA